MNPSLTLAELLRGFAVAADIPVCGIASDSRQLQDGFLFLAVGGITGHGIDYLQEAKRAGVCAVAWDTSTAGEPPDIGVPMIAVRNLAGHLGEIANRFYRYPSSTLKAIGVTGTNGKTTVAWLAAQCLQNLGERCAYVGTLGSGLDKVHGGGGMTTPAAIELHRQLADFVDAGATHAALEVSSHALSQRRVDGIQFDAVLFTNLTRDHLDYHADMQSYFETKASLFLAYAAQHRIVNIDSGFGEQLVSRCGADVVIVSARNDGAGNSLTGGRRHVFARSVKANTIGFDVEIAGSWGNGRFALPLVGEFNIANALQVLAYLLVSGVAIDRACAALELVSAPPGRMQRVGRTGITIDYAHTPDAMASALQALQPHTRDALWCVFGCGGDRDRGKRPLMAGVAERYADRVVITSDNPRSESPLEIIADVVSGLDDKGVATIIEDRAAAIAWAVANAGTDDTILVAGKGHENYQEIGSERVPFSDFAVALAAANAKTGGAEGSVQ